MTELLDERMRIYRYPDEVTYRIDNPVSCEVIYLDPGRTVFGHRIVDAQRTVHEISPGWRFLKMLPKRTPEEIEAEFTKLELNW